MSPVHQTLEFVQRHSDVAKGIGGIVVSGLGVLTNRQEELDFWVRQTGGIMAIVSAGVVIAFTLYKWRTAVVSNRLKRRRLERLENAEEEETKL